MKARRSIAAGREKPVSAATVLKRKRSEDAAALRALLDGGRSQAWLCNKLGVDMPRCWALLNGATSPSEGESERIAALLAE